MEQLRLILLAAMALVGVLLYQGWSDVSAPPAPVISDAPSSPLDGAPTPVGTPAVSDEPPVVPQNGDVPTVEPALTADSDAEDIWVRTDVIEARISRAGGDIRQLRLLDYPTSNAEGAPPLQLLDGSGRDRFFIAQSGVASTEGASPLHTTPWAYDGPRERVLSANDDQLTLVLRWGDAESGRQVERTYHFQRGRYEFEVTQTLINQGEASWRASPYWRLVRDTRTGGNTTPFVQTFTGVATYELDNDRYKYRKHSADDLVDEPQAITQTGGWTGMLEHYFMAVILPPQNEANRFFSRPYKSYPGAFLTEYVAEPIDIAAGASAEHSVRLFIGPKLQNELGAIAPGLELAIDYGLLTPISEPLFWVMDKIHNVVGNWGWSIILITLLVKALFYKLSEAQYKSMARMKKFAPRIQQIKERYADDRQRLHQAMMDLYKKEGFNPLAGCWPMLVQFPVFIALYWVLLESVELRQADFIFWLNDLSAPDPLFVLPVLFGVSMWLQQKLSGQAMTMEPMQQKIMNIMPIGLAIFFTFFPSGLVLYWFVSNVIGIAQQWFITRRIDAS
ncbi:MAG: membrane protein insertase YidC [Oceanococcaceae bacterium]